MLLYLENTDAPEMSHFQIRITAKTITVRTKKLKYRYILRQANQKRLDFSEKGLDFSENNLELILKDRNLRNFII